MPTVKVALFVRLEAKPGKESEVEKFLQSGLAIVQDEPATIAWFALRLGPSEFGISMSPTTRVGRRMCRVGPPRPLTGRSERAPGEIWQVAASFASRGYAA